MHVTPSRDFKKDLVALRNQPEQILKAETIVRELQKADKLYEVSNVKNIVGHKGYYRIKTGNFRLGIRYKNNEIELIRYLHRNKIYKVFP